MEGEVPAIRVGMEDPNDLVRDVGRRILEIRRAAGMTQASFAEAMGASIQYVSRIERGQENLTLHTLARIANVLGVRAIDLLQAPNPEVSDVRRGRPKKSP